MEVSAEALAILLVLLPGFLASRIVGAIAVRRAKRHMGEIIIEALVISVLIYTALGLIGYGVIVFDSAGGSVPRADLGRAWQPLAAAVLFAVLYGTSINHNWHMGLLRWMKVTNRTARTSTWLDVFAEQRGGVVVQYSDGRRLTGWPAFLLGRSR